MEKRLEAPLRKKRNSLEIWRNLLETGALLAAASGVGGKSALETLSEMRDEENQLRSWFLFPYL